MPEIDKNTVYLPLSISDFRGESVAFFQRALDSLKYAIDTVKSNSNLSKLIQDTTLQFANDVIAGKCQIAKRENEFIYHDRVPEELPELPGQALVKGFPFKVAEIGGKDIFHKLIPMEAHAASSMYRYEIRLNIEIDEYQGIDEKSKSNEIEIKHLMKIEIDENRNR